METRKYKDSDGPKKAQVPTTSQHIHNEADIVRVLPNVISCLDSKNMNISRVPGGITNTIYKVTQQKPISQVLLVRIFGGNDVFTKEDRIMENILYKQLSEARIAPKLEALFENGRVEKWLPARNVTLDEMATETVRDGVARAMARLHAFHPYSEGKVKQDSKPHVKIWQVLETWVRDIYRLHSQGLLKIPNVNLDIPLRQYEKIRYRIQEDPQSVAVFAHNDLLHGNIMIWEDGKTVSFVDFEYGGFNYRGFDVANFFCEVMGGTDDGIVDTTRFPDPLWRSAFCRSYLKESFGTSPLEDEVNQFVNEAERFVVLAHLYWGFWATLQSYSTCSDFPYAHYAMERFSLAAADEVFL